MRKILHVDMDAFYASVEQRDHPAWKGLPLLVGGEGRRGVVCAASYEARRFGARSAMSMQKALQLCPQAIVTPPRFSVYEQVSTQVHGIFRRYTDLLEPIALDESYLDVSDYCQRESVKAGQVAQQILRSIQQETALTASAGVAPNKLVAKIASGFRKPNGLTIVSPDRLEAFLAPLPIGELWGVGPVNEKRFRSLGISTIGELAGYDPALLSQQFGHWAPYWQRLAHGDDDREVESSRETKSISAERTFESDLTSPQELQKELQRQAWVVAQRLREAALLARTIVIKLRFSDFSTITRSYSPRDASPTDQAEVLAQRACQLLQAQGQLGPVRLIGLGVSNLSSRQGPCQLELDFTGSCPVHQEQPPPLEVNGDFSVSG